GTMLSLNIRLPFNTEPVNVTARVDESKEVKKGKVFETRVVFIGVDKNYETALADAMEYYRKKGTKQ
ncbi:MAG: hypothetical protein NC914_03410, partial [Candidatus Omnitrophica bacterium]|nr:hypothetical protein [Candidatus Omnitrophota bacterium]